MELSQRRPFTLRPAPTDNWPGRGRLGVLVSRVPLRLTNYGAPMSLSEVRARIDQIDEQIVTLLAARQKLVREAARYKADPQAVRAPDRRAGVMSRLQELAALHGVSADVVHRTYTAMIDAFIDLELHEHARISE